LCLHNITAQLSSTKGLYDTIMLSAVVRDGDTFAYRYLPNISVVANMPKWAVAARKYKNGGASASDAAAFNALRYNVTAMYPYAVATSYVMHDVDSVLAGLYSKDAKNAYKERKEAQLNARFKNEITNMTITQGKILVKLINRQTGKSVYDIIKELKGGGNAVVYQALAILFTHNLKSQYDPNGEDANIEYIVKEIEASGNFKINNLR
jgi:Domain of unknown function (DUF4294)